MRWSGRRSRRADGGVGAAAPSSARTSWRRWPKAPPFWLQTAPWKRGLQAPSSRVSSSAFGTHHLADPSRDGLVSERGSRSHNGSVSDEHLRELERAWKEAGTDEAEALWLRERLRLGTLDLSRVELAAYCGRKGAMLALERPDLQEFSKEATFFLDEAQIDVMQPEFAARCAICMGRLVDLVQAQILKLVPYPNECEPDLLRRVVGSLEAWVLDPSEHDGSRLAEETDERTARRLKVDEFAFLARQAAVTVRAPLALADLSRVLLMRLEQMYPGQGMKILREALSREVGPWLLGYADPVRERAEASPREAADE